MAKAKKLNWTEQGDTLLQAYVKKFKKSPKGVLAVLGTQPGQVLFHAEAKTAERDWDSIGSLTIAVDSALEHLNKVLGAKASATIETSSGVWFERSGPWLIVGSGVKHNSKQLKAIFQHLKKQAKSSGATGSGKIFQSEDLSEGAWDESMKGNFTGS